MPALPAPPARLRWAVLPLLASLAACGGGDAAEPDTGRAAPSALTPVPQVEVAGCVVDEHHALLPGRPVQVLDMYGRVLGVAVSDRHGEFTLRVPGRQWLTIVLQPEGSDLLQARAGDAEVWLTSCLIDTGA